ncbi:MAG: hypothetical protein KDA41_06040, partial [Planctomycetales bacterium]|nr:hypothetical protein [Planctomycetales bacterium]
SVPARRRRFAQPQFPMLNLMGDTMARKARQQFLVDGKVQGSLAFRVAMYWLYCLLAVAVMSSCWMLLFDRPTTSVEFLNRLLLQTAPTLLSSLLLLPLVLMDCVRYSNRFVGPLFRLGRAMQRLADGERVHNVEFRDGDFWFDFAQTFNRLNARVIALEEENKRLAEAASPDAELLAGAR